MSAQDTQALLERLPYTVNLLRVIGESACADAVEAATRQLAMKDEALRNINVAAKLAVAMGDPDEVDAWAMNRDKAGSALKDTDEQEMG